MSTNSECLHCYHWQYVTIKDSTLFITNENNVISDSVATPKEFVDSEIQYVDTVSIYKDYVHVVDEGDSEEDEENPIPASANTFKLNINYEKVVEIKIRLSGEVIYTELKL